MGYYNSFIVGTAVPQQPPLPSYKLYCLSSVFISLCSKALKLNLFLMTIFDLATMTLQKVI